MKKNLRNILVLAMGLMTTVSFAQDWNVDSRTRIDMSGDNDKMETDQAVTLGATSIERHITLDHAMYGSDQAAYINLFDLKMLVSDIKTVKSALGNPEKRVMETEIPIKAKLRKY